MLLKDLIGQQGWTSSYQNGNVTLTNPATGKNTSFTSGQGQTLGLKGGVQDGRNIVNNPNILMQMLGNQQSVNTPRFDTSGHMAAVAKPVTMDNSLQNVSTLMPKFKDPHQGQITNLLSQIQGKINNQNIDVEGDPRYQALKGLAEQNIQQGQQMTMEEMNARGILDSTVTNDRMGQLANQGMTELGAVIPQIYSAIEQSRQAEIDNLMNLTSQYQSESQRQFMNEFTVDQERFTREFAVNQEQFQRDMAVRQNNFNEAIQMGNYNLALDQWDFNKDMALQEFAMQEHLNRFNEAFSMFQVGGRVANKEQADLLGVPVGTITQAARDAAADRGLRYQMHAESLKASNAAGKLQNLAHGIQIARDTGVVPEGFGFEDFGLAPGSDYGQEDVQTKLNNILAAGQLKEIELQEKEDNAVPSIMRDYGVNDATARAIWRVWEPQSIGAAQETLKYHQQEWKDVGVNLPKVREAITVKWGEDPNKKIPWYSDFKSSSSLDPNKNVLNYSSYLK